jgi:hypothetical protein
MPQYVEFSLEGGGAILIESPDEFIKSQSGFVRAGEAARQNAEKAALSFEASLENVRKSADLLVSKLRALSNPPDEMEVFFNLKAVGELGNIVVGKTGAESNYTVSLKWKRELREEGERNASREKDKEDAERQAAAS